MRTLAPSRLKLLAFAAACAVSAHCASAASITATLDRNVVPVGETVTLSVNIEGVNAQVSPQLPALSNVAVRGVSPGYRMVNGQLVGMTFTYTLQATLAGNTTIAPIQLVVGGLALSTQPLPLNIVPPVAAPSSAFLRLIANKTEVYLGEAFPLEIHLYFQHMEDARYPRLHAEGFSLVQSEEPVRTQTQIGGVGYNLFIFKMAATPARAGNLQLGPAECSLTVLIPLPRNPRDPFAGFFGPNFNRSPTNLQSAAVAMRVLPLPSENVPPSFNGAVGAFNMAVSAAPTNLAVGDPITMKVNISGRGRLDGLMLPEQPQWRDFTGYPPNKKVESSDPLGLSGTVAFEKVLIPQNHEVRTLAPFEFSFFDPAQKQYRTLKGQEFPLSVRSAAVTAVPPPVPTNATSSAEQQADDILHIRAQFAAGSAGVLLVRQPWFLALQAAPVAAWLGLLIARKRREALANNPKARRQREVARRVREGLQELHALAAAQNSDAFFATLFRLLQEQIGERLDVSASSITESIVDERLRHATLPPPTLTELRELFQMCDQARYAPHKTRQELSAIIPRAEGVLRDLQKLQI
jgi:oxygen tolerance protein BatD